MPPLLQVFKVINRVNAIGDEHRRTTHHLDFITVVEISSTAQDGLMLLQFVGKVSLHSHERLTFFNINDNIFGTSSRY